MSLSGAVFESDSGCCFRSVENGSEQSCACVVQTLRGFIIADCGGLRVELLEAHSGFQELLCQG
jgi:hypothetical protein